MYYILLRFPKKKVKNWKHYNSHIEIEFPTTLLSAALLTFLTNCPTEMPSATTEYPTPLTTTISNPRLRLLNVLKDGKYPLMTFMALSSVRVAQIVALCDFDGKHTFQPTLQSVV